MMSFNRLRCFITTSFVTTLMGLVLFSIPVIAAQPDESTQQRADHQLAIESWRANRHQRLQQTNGWLTLVGAAAHTVLDPA